MKTIYVVLFLSILASAEAEMNWVVYKKITDFGQTIVLYCHLDELCKENAGWVKWWSSSNYETLILSVKETRFEEDSKYDGRVGTNGFFLMIRNVSLKDFETNYSCTYSIYTSPMKLLTRSDAFVETKTSIVKTTDDFESQTLVIYLLCAIVIILVAAVLFLSVCLYRVKRQMGLLNRSQDGRTPRASRDVIVGFDSEAEDTPAGDQTPMIRCLNNLHNSTNHDAEQLSQGASHNSTESSPEQLHTMNSTRSNDPTENATSSEETGNLRHDASSSSHHSLGMRTCLENEQMEYNGVVNSEPAKIEDYLKSGYESLQSDSGKSQHTSQFASLVVNSETNDFRTATVKLNTEQQKNLKENTVVKTCSLFHSS